MKPSTSKTKLPPSTQLRKAVFGGSLKLTRFRTRTAKFILGLFLVSGSVPAWGQEIRAKQEGESTIRVVSDGRFETTFTKRSGFGTTWFDLKNDPSKRRDLGPRVGGEYGGGLLWVKFGVKERDGSFEPTPIEELELLEAGPARVRVELRGVHNRYGLPGPGRPLAELRYTMVYTLYPDGNVAIGYALEASQDVPIPGFLIITRSTGAWGTDGKGEGKGEVHAAGEFGDEKPSGKTASSFTLQWSDGPTHFTDILMVAHRGRYNGNYWHEGYKDEDYRTALNLRSGPGFFQEDALRKGTTHLSLLMRLANDMNSGKEAARYANDYRSPDKLSVTSGESDASDEGDRDQDGFNEEEGCYVLKGVPDGVEFTLHGSKVARMNPAFKVKGWKGLGTPRLTMGGKPLVQGADFQASSSNGVLLVKLARIVDGDVPVSITAQESKPAPEAAKDAETGFTPLFNGKDLSGWAIRMDPNKEGIRLKMEDVCSVSDGVLTGTAKPYGWLYTIRNDYTNYILKLEWRWPEQEKQARPPNSGVFLRMGEPNRKCYAAGLSYGGAGNLWTLGRKCDTDPKRSNRYRCEMSENAEKPYGEWNEYVITVDGGDITLDVNGKVVNKGTDAEIEPGNIGLQLEVGTIQFRNIRIKELKNFHK